MDSCPDICGWSALAPGPPTFEAPDLTNPADFAIVGAGFTGLAAARRLAELCPDKRILVIEAKQAGGGASARNSGFVVANESPGHAQLHTDHGRASYLTMNRIDRAGVDTLRRLVRDHAINCQWEDTGSIHAAHDPAHFDRLYRHERAFRDLGIDARLIQADALRDRLGTAYYGLGVESRGGALVQPAMLVHGLLHSLPDTVEIAEQTTVHRIEKGKQGWALETSRGKVQAAQVIVAVNAFFPRLGLKAARVFPLALTASLTRPLTANEEEQIGHAASWGVLSPRSLGATMRLTRDRRILIRNTAEYRPAGISPRLLAARKQAHINGLRRRFPFLDTKAISHSWSGTICISRNAKPVFEQVDKGLFLCGGYNASGVARGSILGRLVAEYALGEQSALLGDVLSLTRPSRLPPRPFLDLGVKLRLLSERRAARKEA